MTSISPRRCFTRLASLFIAAALLLAACAPAVPVVVPTVVSANRRDPTSILIVLRSPTPSTTPGPTVTPAPPTETPTPDPGLDDPEAYYGGLVINMDQVGQTLMMKPKNAFLLRLGEDYAWAVTIDPPDLVTLNKKIILEQGEQGVFVARRTGKGVLRAVGDPVCRQTDPPCVRPSLLFTLKIIVQ